MPTNLPDPKELGHYYSLAQVGLEMVVPVALGLWLESYFDWRPWGVVVGAVVGLVTGVTHLVAILDRGHKNGSPKQRQDKL
jgi:F0F1-type ATP synthase assembly protein I